MTKKSIGLLTYGAIIIFVLLIPVITQGVYYLHVLILTMMYIVLASSLRLINLTGQLSLAHAGMLLIGAYTSALLVMKAGVSSWLALVIAGIVAMLFSAFLCSAFVKLKGIYFTMVTIFAGSIISLIIYQWSGLTNGASGIFGIPRPDPIHILGILNITFDSKIPFYYLIWLLMAISLVVMWFIEHSRIGMTFRAIQQSESLAKSVGINTTVYKVAAFALGCFFSGLMGGFYSQYINTIDPVTFGFSFMIYTLIYMQVGGKGKFIGPIIGAVVLSLLPEFARPLKNYEPFLFAIILVLVIFLMPEGLVGLPQRFKNMYQSISKRRTPIVIKKEKV
jgi:branched-chain amino acid transport system permease protein